MNCKKCKDTGRIKIGMRCFGLRDEDNGPIYAPCDAPGCTAVDRESRDAFRKTLEDSGIVFVTTPDPNDRLGAVEK